MRRAGLAAALTAALAVPGVAGAAGSARIAEGPRGETLRADVELLAAEALEGRMTGTPGERRAAKHIAERLEALGAEPLPGRAGLIHEFEFTAGTSDGGSRLLVATPAGARRFKGGDEVRALSFSDSGSVSGGIVFAGYGLTVPAGGGLDYDSYAGLDVAGKVVLVLRYVPEDADEEVRQQLLRYSGLRYKALQARERGASAMLVVTGPRSPNAGETIDLSFDAALSGSGIVAASIGGAVAEALFAAAGERKLEDVQRALDDANPHVVGFDLPGLSATIDARVVRERRSGRNVVGWLPATEPGGEARPAILLGAHLDHLGRGRHGNSLARKGEAGGVHRGADDNASGVAAVLAIGDTLAAGPRRYPVALAFWSGEELGLLGSSRFVDDGWLPPERILAYLNFDMVGRMREERLTLQAAGSSDVWPRLVERANVPEGLDVVLQDDPYLPTDSASFYQARVPTLNFFTGSHEDYHRPTDVPERIDWAGLERVVRLGARIAGQLDALAERPEWIAVARKASPLGGGRDTVRAYTGTIPDYTTEVEGLRLAGVIGGGPAESAGLREGDVIVELGGRKITNIYDYTYALDAVKIGEPIVVVLLRDGERHEATITPTARP